MPTLTRNQIIALAGFIIILIAIPISFYLVKQTQIFKSKAAGNTTANNPVTKTPPVSGSSNSDLLKAMQGSEGSTSSASLGDTTNLAFGPTLNLTISIEGRPASKQAGKVFVGLSAEGVKTNPTYILTFTIDVPDSGIFKGLSLAGLNPGSNYTAYIKGAAQIDTASNFTMAPTETTLNDNKPIILISGDLNEDNTINAADYSIAKTLYGTTSKSSNWNNRADFNMDGVINNYDLTFITKNMGKIGASGPWISTPQSSSGSATPSAGLINKPNVGGPASPSLGGPPTDFGSILSTSTNSASVSGEPTHSPYWILVP